MERNRVGFAARFLALLALVSLSVGGIVLAASPGGRVAAAARPGVAPYAPNICNNLARLDYGGTIAGFSSNYGGGWQVTNLIDGLANTAWATAQDDTSNAYAIVDLAGEIQTVRSVSINPQAIGSGALVDNIKDFAIRVSTTTADPAAFTTVFTGTLAQDAGLTPFDIPPSNAKYVMLVGVNNYGGRFIEATEFEVYACSNAAVSYTNTPTPPVTPVSCATETNIALAANGGAIAGFSTNYGAGWDVSNLIDGNPATGWASLNNQTVNQYVILDLAGDTQPIHKIRINPSATGGDSASNNTRTYDILVSTTGTDPEDFTSLSSGVFPQENQFFAWYVTPVQAKYVKFLAVNNYGGAYTEAAEVEIYGCPAFTPTVTASPSDTATVTATRTATPTRTDTPTRTTTITRTATVTPTPTRTATATATPGQCVSAQPSDPDAQAAAAVPTATPPAKPAPAAAPERPNLITIPGAPLYAEVYPDGNYALSRNGVQQYYRGEAEGVFMWINGKVWGPDNVYGGVPLGPPVYGYFYQNESLSGDGSAANPWVATLDMFVVDRILGNNTGLSLRQRLNYINGQAYMRNDWEVCNVNGPAYTNIHLFHAADLYTAGNDRGTGFYDAATGAVGGYNEARDNYQIFVPITPPNHYMEGRYSEIWNAIGTARDTPGGGFLDQISTEYLDNGAGLEWIFDLGQGACKTISDHISFAEIPVVPTPPPTVPPDASNTPTATATVPGQPSATPTATATNGPCGPATATPTLTPDPNATATPTPPPGSTATNTRRPTYTPAPTFTPGPTNTATATRTPGGPTPLPCNPTFSDVRSTDYFYGPVRSLACVGAISGYADGTFRPYNNTTRSQLVKIVVVAENWPILRPPAATFVDVAENSTFYAFIETAVAHQIISGYADRTFRPFADVTRGQVTKIISIAERWPLIDPVNPRFRDVSADNPFYVFIETAAAKGVISGYSDANTCGGAVPCFKWGANATRGQLSKIVYNARALAIGPFTLKQSK